ncbi:hypothetical protein GIB67_014206 [Kingdonia uniflora]|uniref:Uncharacterized protein n=1 Tax=Kingdonia uniflora TaxID=39325 RepID=A0A7J7M1T1_9MAGN|nr:hypothetical protein GIB67_014206 [Kingdonia uniflora]
MCIAVFVWQSHPIYPYLLLLNKGEYHKRPTTPIYWWEGCKILGGRDEFAGGTWLACTRDGRLAFLTNVMESPPFPEAKSRGDLPVRFLKVSRPYKQIELEIIFGQGMSKQFRWLFGGGGGVVALGTPRWVGGDIYLLCLWFGMAPEDLRGTFLDFPRFPFERGPLSFERISVSSG